MILTSRVRGVGFGVICGVCFVLGACTDPPPTNGDNDSFDAILIKYSS